MKDTLELIHSARKNIRRAAKLRTRALLAMSLVCLLTLVSFTSLSDHASAQGGSAKPAGESDAQKSFAALKSLAGQWEGLATMPGMPGMKEGGQMLHVSLRVMARGNAIMHEYQEANTPLDSTKYDHPVSMLYLEEGQLMLVHYCDAGNRPRMIGKISPDGKKIEFEFKDITGRMDRHMNMNHAVFTMIDANHHTEDWTFMIKDKPLYAHIDLQRQSASQTPW